MAIVQGLALKALFPLAVKNTRHQHQQMYITLMLNKMAHVVFQGLLLKSLLRRGQACVIGVLFSQPVQTPKLPIMPITQA